MKKNGIFTFKKWDIKTRWLCLGMVEIMFPRSDLKFEIFPGKMSPDPSPHWGTTFGSPIFLNPLS